MASGYSPFATILTRPPGTSASVVRTPTPSVEMSVVIAQLSALKCSTSNMSLIGIAAGRRSDRRGTAGIFVGIGNPSSFDKTTGYALMLSIE